MTTLTDQERRALDEFLSANWAEFLRVANSYLTDDEAGELSNKLSQEK